MRLSTAKNENAAFLLLMVVIKAEADWSPRMRTPMISTTDYYGRDGLSSIYTELNG